MTTKTKTKAKAKAKANIDSIVSIAQKDCANFACLLDMLVDHPDIQSHKTLMGSASAIKEQFIGLWDKLEAEAEKVDQGLAM